ncbi:MAG TPA: hypothetical protein VGP44_03090, partial [Gemmatimonadales bacterium]|nr:hypothetical protein [Gemmatimonadales bacterium]
MTAAPAAGAQPARSFDSSPTVVGSTVYIGSRTGMFDAYNTQNGAVRWHKQLGFGSATTCSAKGIVSTAPVTTDPHHGEPDGLR